jgi:hypothetical protein
MPSAGFEPAILATKRPQTYDLDRADTEIGKVRALPYTNSNLIGYKSQFLLTDIVVRLTSVNTNRIENAGRKCC